MVGWVLVLCMEHLLICHGDRQTHTNFRWLTQRAIIGSVFAFNYKQELLQQSKTMDQCTNQLLSCSTSWAKLSNK